jgi:site-specific DNA-methyltransferase (adenine-specific)
VLRVLKPGAHLVAFSGTRTYHRMACAIEDAGFEIRDQLQWLYGSGFPKSHKAADGWGTALKPASEPIAFARKPLIGTVRENFELYGTGVINIDDCRVGTASTPRKDPRNGNLVNAHMEMRPWMERRIANGEPLKGDFDGDKGRWPANVIHDGSDEVVGCFPDSDGQQGVVTGQEPSNAFGGTVRYGNNGIDGIRNTAVPRNDCGSAARFFYAAKADADDRLNSKHPTVKPIDLMQWLVRLVTPKGGLCLDPFAGTGTTGEAAWREGMHSILIEREERFVADIHRRIELMQAGPFERAGKLATQEAAESLPLFAA